MSPNDRAAKALVILLALSLSPTSAGAQSADPSKAQAQASLREGNTLLEQGRPSEALQKFADAYRLFPSPKLHYNIGQAQSLIPGHEAQAYEAMARFLNEAQDANPELRAAAETQRERLRSKVGLVSVAIDPPDAQLVVDGVGLGKPASEAPLALAIGKHTLAIKKDGRAAAAETITLKGGDTSNVRLRLPPVIVAPAVALPPPPVVVTAPPVTVANVITPPMPSVSERVPAAVIGGGYWTQRHKIGAVLAAVGAASLVFGLVEYVRYFSKADDFRKAGCGTNDLSIGVNCQSLDNQFKSAQVAWIVGYLGAAAFGASGTYFLWLAPAGSAGAVENGAAMSMSPGMTVKVERRF